ncbi:MAG: deoxyribose-phosphate aldolase [Gammaproteobacteria bacterium]|nr:deoxyribose-phosphate aldolase [Gammaproteobacteria bacterium]
MSTNKDNKYWAQLALSLMDLTSLNDDDCDNVIHDLCIAGNTPFGQVAAVCVYPQFINTAVSVLDENHARNIKVATVTNFPHGSDNVKRAKKETKAAAKAGAHEVDVVFPYNAFLKGDEKIGGKLVKKCSKVCKKRNVELKVIIESGELKTPEFIQRASEIAIANGADFIKTSTGKVPINATLESAEIMLKAIKDSGKNVGFKAAGGVRTVEDAKAYLQLAEKIMGAEWISPKTFRFGASGLLGSLLAVLNDEQASENTSAY